VHYTASGNSHSGDPEDGRDQRHVELIGIINKPLLLHLVGVHVIYMNDARSNRYQIIKILFTFFMVEDNLLTKPLVLAERSFEYREIGRDRRKAE